MFKVGTEVIVPTPPIRGVVKRLSVDDGGTNVTHVVEYKDAAGQTQQRHFTAEQLKAVESDE